MVERYRFEYSAESVYGHVVRLLAKHAIAHGEVIFDIGCGYGAIAEPVRELGYHYVGVDIESEGLADLNSRGFETALLDLRDVASVSANLKEILRGRELAGLAALDVIEHLIEGPALLASLHELARSDNDAPLVISIPQVTHVDLIGKALIGRWDVTPTGLLDETHVSLYSPIRLQRVFDDAGWELVEADDFVLEESDQHFPPTSAPLRAGAPLHDYLKGVRERAAGGSTVNQFVRSYRPRTGASTAIHPKPDTDELFLTVIVPVTPTDLVTLEDTILCLDAQSIQRFELIVCTDQSDDSLRSSLMQLLERHSETLLAKTIVIDGDGEPIGSIFNRAIERAGGRYVTVLSPDVAPFGNWIECFATLAEPAPGAVLCAVPGAQRSVRSIWPTDVDGYEAVAPPSTPEHAPFSLLEHLFEDVLPQSSYAIPRSAFVDLGIRFDDELGDDRNWWVFIAAALCCGVESDDTNVTTLQRGFTERLLTSRPIGELARRRLQSTPLLLPPESIGAIERLLQENERHHGLIAQSNGSPTGRSTDQTRELEAEVSRLRAEVIAFEQSTSWRATAPLRALMTQLRSEDLKRQPDELLKFLRNLRRRSRNETR